MDGCVGTGAAGGCGMVSGSVGGGLIGDGIVRVGVRGRARARRVTAASSSAAHLQRRTSAITTMNASAGVAVS